MPNHCHNRVTFYAHHSDGDESCNQIAKIKQIFEDENAYIQEVLIMIADDPELGQSNKNYVKIQARYNK